jgi:glutamate---cysteine ligase / carboxylate-amine ligase
MSIAPIPLFQAYGVELEYMIVDSHSLDIRPVTDLVLAEVAGEDTTEVEMGRLAWSNELALHVIELKTNGPARTLSGLAEEFQQHVLKINGILNQHRAQLMPSAMHPWMDPIRQLTLWPHEYNPVYETFNRIFDCRGHGWANLQSVHLNLPFANDEEFARLHAAIRLLLPILPALAASSPFADREATGWMDYRMEVYRHNSRRIPAIAGQIVPEDVFSRAEYERRILQPMYQQIAPHDPEKVLQHEWLNARGAIARFMRNTIEIRVLDVQECPQADLAICDAVVSVLRRLVDQSWTSLAEQQKVATDKLAELFRATIKDAEQTLIEDAKYLAHFGLGPDPVTAGQIWITLARQLNLQSQPLRQILDHGPLARRLAAAVQSNPQRLPEVYRRLCHCLATGQMFLPEASSTKKSEPDVRLV